MTSERFMRAGGQKDIRSIRLLSTSLSLYSLGIVDTFQLVTANGMA